MVIYDKFKIHLQGQGLSGRTVNSYLTTMHRFAKRVEQAYGSDFDTVTGSCNDEQTPSGFVLQKFLFYTK